MMAQEEQKEVKWVILRPLCCEVNRTIKSTSLSWEFNSKVQKKRKRSRFQCSHSPVGRLKNLSEFHQAASRDRIHSPSNKLSLTDPDVKVLGWGWRWWWVGEVGGWGGILFFPLAMVNHHKGPQPIHKQQHAARRSFRFKKVVSDKEDEVLCWQADFPLIRRHCSDSLFCTALWARVSKHLPAPAATRRLKSCSSAPAGRRMWRPVNDWWKLKVP